MLLHRMYDEIISVAAGGEENGAPKCQSDKAEAKAAAAMHTHGADVMKTTTAKKGEYLPGRC